MNPQLNPNDIDVLVNILANQANQRFYTPQEYFNNLVSSAHLLSRWLRSVADMWGGDPNIDARKLVNWPINQKANPDDPSHTTLGALLRALIGQQLPPDDAKKVAAIMVSNGLTLDETKPDEIKIRYDIPVRASTPSAATPLTPSEQEQVVRIICQQASIPFLDKPQDYFNDLVASAYLPEQARFAGWAGDPVADAKLLLQSAWTLEYPDGHARAGQNTLGWVLRDLLDRQPLSPEDSQKVIKIILNHNLISDPQTLQALQAQGGFSV